MSQFVVLKPENILKKAQDLLSIGQKDAAIATMREPFAKRIRFPWTKALEDLTDLYLSLCIENLSSSNVKEALIQYRNICSQYNHHSLENVIRKLFSNGRQHFESSKSKFEEKYGNFSSVAPPSSSSSSSSSSMSDQKHSVDQVVADEDEDDESVENWIVQNVTSETAKSRNQRKFIYKPLKFLWECHRIVLDLLKNLAKLEDLYFETIRETVQLLSYKVDYNQKIEFTKLYEALYSHLKKQINSQVATETTLTKLIESRFHLFDAALSLEAWQEAFKAAQNISELIDKRPVKPHIQFGYYEKLAELFLRSDNHFYHAYTLVRLFHLSKSLSLKLPLEQQQQIASQALVAALSVPYSYSKDSPLEAFNKDKNVRLAGLLGNHDNLSRENLINEISLRNMPGSVSPQLADLYKNLEIKVHPLQLFKLVSPSLEYIQSTEKLSHYYPLLLKNTFAKLLTQLSKVFKSVTFSFLANITDDKNLSEKEIEKLTMHGIRSTGLDARIDIQKSAIHFGAKTFDSSDLKYQLSTISSKLEESLGRITQKSDADSHHRSYSQNTWKKLIASQHEATINRKLLFNKTSEEADQIKKLSVEIRELEAELEREKAPKFVPPQPQEPFSYAAAAAAATGSIGNASSSSSNSDSSKVAPSSESASASVDTVQPSKPDKNVPQFVQKLMKEIDYFERARRELEIPEIEKWHHAQEKIDFERYQKQKEEEIKESKKKFEESLATKTRFSKMLQDKEQLVNQVIAIRTREVEALKEKEEAHNNVIRQKIEVERARLRAERLKSVKEEALKKMKEEFKRKTDHQKLSAKPTPKPSSSSSSSSSSAFATLSSFDDSKLSSNSSPFGKSSDSKYGSSLSDRYGRSDNDESDGARWSKDEKAPVSSRIESARSARTSFDSPAPSSFDRSSSNSFGSSGSSRFSRGSDSSDRYSRSNELDSSWGREDKPSSDRHPARMDGEPRRGDESRFGRSSEPRRDESRFGRSSEPSREGLSDSHSERTRSSFDSSSSRYGSSSDSSRSGRIQDSSAGSRYGRGSDSSDRYPRSNELDSSWGREDKPSSDRHPARMDGEPRRGDESRFGRSSESRFGRSSEPRFGRAGSSSEREGENRSR